MNLKLGKMNAKTIVNGILSIGIIYTIIMLLTIISDFLLIPGTPGNSPIETFNNYMYIIKIWATPILGICLIKLICEALYKILIVAEIIINKMLWLFKGVFYEINLDDFYYYTFIIVWKSMETSNL